MSDAENARDDEINTKCAVDFLRGWPTPNLVLSARPVDPKTGKEGAFVTKAFRAPIDWAEVHKWILVRQGRSNLWFSVNDVTPQDKKSEKKDVQHINAFHIDSDARLDEPQADARARISKLMQAYDPKPSAIIFSGNGCQAFWLLAEPIEIGGDEAKAEDAERYNRQLIADLDGDAGTHNADRIMRCPYTVNLPNVKKRGKGREVALAEIIDDNMARHPLSAFKQAAPVDKPEEAAGATARTLAVKIERSAVAWDHLPRIQSLDELDRWDVDYWARMNIVHGDNVAYLHECHVSIGHRELDGPYPGGRSDALWAVVCELARQKVPQDVALGIITDKNWSISDSVLEKKDARRYALKQINDGYGKVAAEVLKKTDPEGPRWHETYDMHGLAPKPSYRNARVAIQHMGIVCRFDSFHQRLIGEYEGEAHDIAPLIGEVSNAALISLRQLIAEHYDFDPRANHVYDAVLSLAHRNVFNPITDYLTEAEGVWDGKPRLDTLAADYFGAPSDEYEEVYNAFMRLMLIAAVRRARDPGCKFDTICVLEGIEGTNKSSAIEALAGKENFSDQTILGVKDQQQQEAVAGVWLYEIADLTGGRTADVNAVKAFASRTVDRVRKVYERMRADVPRSCVLFGTTNDQEYLRSHSGNRRFWPLPTTTIKIDDLRRDRDQIWAEAAIREGKGESILLDKKLWPLAAELQEGRRVRNPWEDVLIERAPDAAFVVRGKNGEARELRISSAKVLELLDIPIREQGNSDLSRKVATIMLKIGWKRHDSRLVWIGEKENGKRVRGFFREYEKAGGDDAPF
jgi:hypothetical protein